MRRFVVIIALVLGIAFVACTASVSIYRPSVDSRVTESCDELSLLCQSSGRACAELTTFCGPAKSELAQLFTIEDACKSSCADDIGCIKTCKGERLQKMSAILSAYDFDNDGVIGDGASACSNLSQLCTSSGEACPATEFFCIAAAPAPSPCSVALDECKASCAPHDRVCRGDCRKAYRQCLAGPAPDAGVPDAPTAPTTPTTYNLTYGTTSGSTGTGTITLNPAGTSCGANCATYAANTSVTLTAKPSNGSTFGGWTGCTSTTTSCTVTMTAARTVTARFTAAVTGFTYTKDIAPKMTGLCNGCHGDAGAPAGYRTDSYTGLFGNGSDNTPNIIAGNANSEFVVKIAGNHKNVLGQYPGFDTVVRDWVVLYNAAQ